MKTQAIEVHRHSDVASFITRAEPWLVLREAEHNVLLGLLPKLLSGKHEFEEPIYLASIEMDGKIAGCAFRTPPFKLGLTRLPSESIAPLAEDVARIYPELPAVLGRKEEAVRFAEAWTRMTGSTWCLGTRQRIHALERVAFPGSSPGGSLRRAVKADVSFLVEWIEAFSRDTGTLVVDSRSKADELVREEAIHVWEDGEPRSMVAVAARTPHGARVAYVYTPPPFRSLGYATVAVASLSDRLLQEGRRFCFLYTDLSNPISNAIYARIGYEPVCDVVDVDFDSGWRSAV